MTSTRPIADPLTLTDGDLTVSLWTLQTPTGERLILSGESAETRVDALALESLTWQDDEVFEELTSEPHEDGMNATEPSDELQISNEYTVVKLRKVETTAGPRLSITSPKLNYACRLSPAELDALTHKRINFFSDLLETPFGPEEDQHHGVH
ncbi:hypothetical protein [Halostagnicola sp. A56]|uniref:hypothetical protein n=1 Tax=Halostagnicola sp. A56 TaxID=1495067 RepID=UPI00049EC37C|nr:hypothetical protein [Halostagnicola sp. A56]